MRRPSGSLRADDEVSTSGSSGCRTTVVGALDTVPGRGRSWPEVLGLGWADLEHEFSMRSIAGPAAGGRHWWVTPKRSPECHQSNRSTKEGTGPPSRSSEWKATSSTVAVTADMSQHRHMHRPEAEPLRGLLNLCWPGRETPLRRLLQDAGREQGRVRQ